MALIEKNKNWLTPFDSFFDDLWGGNNLPNLINRSTMPAVNVSETETAYEVEVATPGMKKEDIKVDLDHNVLTISAETESEKEEKTENGKKVTRREFSYSSFKRSFTLPENVKAEEIGAAYEDGVLKLQLPKKEVTAVDKTKKIEIK